MPNGRCIICGEWDIDDLHECKGSRAMCNDHDQTTSMHHDSIELTITVAGHRWHLKRDLPLVVRASSGRMSIRAGLEPVTDRMLQQAIEELVDMAVIVLDQQMPHPRETWWQIEEAFEQRDEG